jgi:putative sterol carrier protein
LEVAARSETYREAAADWEGDFLCTIEGDEAFLADLRREAVMEGYMSFFGMMSPDQRKKYAGTPMGDLLEQKLGVRLEDPLDQLDVAGLAEKISKLSADDLAGAPIYLWADFWHGSVRTMIPVAPGEHEDAVFKLAGKYASWKLMVSGDQDAIRLIMSNRLSLEGDLQYVMKRMKAVVTLTKEVFAGVPID